LRFNEPRFTTHSPHIYHQKTTFCTPFFSKTPCKNMKKWLDWATLIFAVMLFVSLYYANRARK